MLLLDRLERQFLAVYQAVISHGGEPPKWHEEQARFDEALAAEPMRLESVDSEQMELRRAMGVA